MAKKKADKEIKRLKKKAKEARAANLALEKRIRKLTRKLDTRNKQIADLQNSLGRTLPATGATKTPTAEIGVRDGSDIASSHRSAWKQHSYLRDRYEFHLGAGASKERARRLANEDLKTEYGKDHGYTEEELSAILS